MPGASTPAPAWNRPGPAPAPQPAISAAAVPNPTKPRVVGLLEGRSVGWILLAVGTVCILAAALAFVLVAWRWMPWGARAGLLVAVGMAAGALADRVHRRSLLASAEALSVVAMALAVAAWGAAHTGVLGRGVPWKLPVLVGLAVLAASAFALDAMGRPRGRLVATDAATGLAVAGAGAVVAMTEYGPLGLPGAILVASLVIPAAYRSRWARSLTGWGMLAAAALGLTRLVGEGGHAVADHPSSLAVLGYAWPALAAAALLLAVHLLPRHTVVLPRVSLSALGAGVALAVWASSSIPLLPAGRAHVLVAVAGVLAALAALRGSTDRWRTPMLVGPSAVLAALYALPGLGSALADAFAVIWRTWDSTTMPARSPSSAALLALLAISLLPTAALLHRRWVRAGGRDGSRPQPESAAAPAGPPSPGAAPVPASASSAGSAPRPAQAPGLAPVAPPITEVVRQVRRTPAHALLVLAAGTALAMAVLAALPSPWLVLAAGVMVALLAVGGRRVGLESGWALPTLLGTLGVAVRSDVVGGLTLPAVAAVCAVAMRREGGLRERAGALWAVAAAAALDGAALWTGAVQPQLATTATVTALGLVVAIASTRCSAPSRQFTEGWALLTFLAAAIVMPRPDAATESVVLLGAGAAFAIVAIRRPDRRWGIWVAACLWLLASWLQLASYHVGAPEPYTLPTAALLLLAGAQELRRRAARRSWETLLPGLLVACVPTAWMAFVHPDSLRTVLLVVLAAASVWMAVRLRLAAPLVVGALVLLAVAGRVLVPMTGELPPWAPLALAGIVCVGLGATWEARVRDLKAAGRYLRALR